MDHYQPSTSLIQGKVKMATKSSEWTDDKEIKKGSDPAQGTWGEGGPMEKLAPKKRVDHSKDVGQEREELQVQTTGALSRDCSHPGNMTIPEVHGPSDSKTAICPCHVETESGVPSHNLTMESYSWNG